MVTFWEGRFIFICYHISFFLSVYSEIIILIDSIFDKCDLLREGRVFLHGSHFAICSSSSAFLSEPLKKNNNNNELLMYWVARNGLTPCSFVSKKNIFYQNRTGDVIEKILGTLFNSPSNFSWVFLPPPPQKKGKKINFDRH